jgi:hypothetical protein
VPGGAGGVEVADAELSLGDGAPVDDADDAVGADAAPVGELHGADGAGGVAEFVADLADVVVEGGGVVGADDADV